MTERDPATSTSNRILSVTHREEVLQGKKKVGEAENLKNICFLSTLGKKAYNKNSLLKAQKYVSNLI